MKVPIALLLLQILFMWNVVANALTYFDQDHTRDKANHFTDGQVL